MKKNEKMKLINDATERINECVRTGKLQDVDINDIVSVMPGGKSLDALFTAARALHETPGMRMGELHDFVCVYAELNSANAGWVTGRTWGDSSGFGGIGLLWERRKERHENDKRAVWHYYLLPPGRALAESDIDPRAKLIKENLELIEISPKPGVMMTLRLYIGGKLDESNYLYGFVTEEDSPFLTGDKEPSVNIVVGYGGFIVKMMPVSWSSKLQPRKVLVTADGPDSPDWKDVIRSRSLFVACMRSAPEVQMLLIDASSIAGVKREDDE